MNEPSPHLAEANDMELATYPPPSESRTVWYASVFAAAMVCSTQRVLLPYRRLAS